MQNSKVKLAYLQFLCRRVNLSFLVFSYKEFPQHYNCSQNALRMGNISDLRLMLLYVFLFLTYQITNGMRRTKTPVHEMTTGIIHFLEPFAFPAIIQETSFTCRNNYCDAQTVQILTVPFPYTLQHHVSPLLPSRYICRPSNSQICAVASKMAAV